MTSTAIGTPTVKLPARKVPPPPPKPSKKKPEPPDPAALKSALDAVLGAPDDNELRLAYAELLRADDDPRGDFIAVGLALAEKGNATEREDPTTGAHWDVFRELHQRHSAKWTKPLKTLGPKTRWRWHRGFIEELRIDGWEAGCTPGNLSAVLAAEPVRELAIDGGDDDLLARLLALPGIERVKRLAISGWDANQGGAPYVGKVLGKAKRLTGVTELRAGVMLGDAGVQALLDANTLGSVVHLAIGRAQTTTKVFAKFAASELGQRLEILEWLREPIEADMAKIIVTMPSLHTFVGSIGYVDAVRDTLTKRFRDRLVIDDEPGKMFLIDGIKGVSHRPAPKR